MRYSFVVGRRTRHRCDVGAVTSNVNNMTSSPAGAGNRDNCAVYRLCLRRRLLYHGVVLLGPAACVTVLLLTVLATSPALTVKLPGAMSVVVVSCVLLQLVGSMTPSATLPVIGR